MRLCTTETIKRIRFGLYTPAEIEQVAVVEINQNKRQGDHSVYDLRMGPIDSGQACVTCKQSSNKCPGHYGYIKLALPIFHPKLVKRLETLLRLICVNCYRCIFSGTLGRGQLAHVARLRLSQLIERVRDGANYCTHGDCRMRQPEIKANVAENSMTFTTNDCPLTMTPSQIFFLVSNVTREQLDYMGIECDLKGFVIFNLLVLPNAARPILKTDTLICDDDLTLQYLDIIKTSNDLRIAIDTLDTEKISVYFTTLNYRISVMFNNTGKTARYNANMRPFKSLYERINGKEGQFRKNAMSKRADKTARTVISPNPLLCLHQLQIPRQLAANLTIPQIVSPFNFTEACSLFAAGKLSVIQKANSTHQIDAAKFAARGGTLTMGDVFWRNLQDGDWVLFNRQPTLHAPSMQAMQIVLGDAKTFSFNLANCPAYNADMDGDEMNIHVPQTIEAIVEMQLLSRPENWLVSEATGAMNFGLVQDSLLAAHLMSRDTNTMDIGDWFQIMFAGSITPRYPLQLTPRGIIESCWPSTFSYKSNNIEVFAGHIVSGAITKAEIGYGSRGLLLAIFREFGRHVTAQVLNSLQLACVAWLTNHGFSIGLADCVSPAPTEIACLKQTWDSARETTSHINETVDAFRDKIGNIIKSKSSPTNNMIKIIEAGSKGNWINLIQINGTVGQQYVNGNRIHLGVGSTLLQRDGFVRNSYIEGLAPAEFFCHLIAAREAISKTATTTAVTGYLQRRLVKSCENQVVQYDETIRSGKRILYFGSNP